VSIWLSATSWEREGEKWSVKSADGSFYILDRRDIPVIVSGVKMGVGGMRNPERALGAVVEVGLT
jgi:hypothetical protein